MFLKVKTLLGKIVPCLDYTRTPDDYVAPADISVPTGTSIRNFTNFTLSAKGTYLIIVFVTFTGTTTSGKKFVNVSATSASSTALTSMSYMDANPVSIGGRTTINFSFIAKNEAASKVLYVNGMQNSGATETVQVRIHTIRLR